ncbi:hypothetical protein B0I35DRAFT_442555 [Stachybotrys elegans]|uniref:Uncharacterized protein n=1 Tax=Stachybotrys elegans TaxID=80388 RepID=A0A8K0SFI0_9HYPO|nr:hypothetical protein B0I35DRAFT_442555 [Stachybotrys elegans]
MAKLVKNFWTQHWPPRATFTDANVPAGSQAGRVFMVTGGNGGVGLELCKLLYKTGGTVYLTTRSQEKGEKAIEAIVASTSPNAPGLGLLKVLVLDLNDLQSVKDAVQKFTSQESRLDILWNNAGLGGNAVVYGSKTAQGIETFMGVHCVAHQYLTELLIPQLKAATKPRVVWMGSALIDSMAPSNGIDFSLLDTGLKNTTATYAMSRAGSWMLGREFATRHKADGIISVVANPGNLDTGMFNGTPAAFIFILRHTMLHKPILGGYTNLYAGFSNDVTLDNSGIYVFPWGRLRPDDELVRQDIVKAIRSEEEGGLGHAGKFWSWCEEHWKSLA